MDRAAGIPNRRARSLRLGRGFHHHEHRRTVPGVVKGYAYNTVPNQPILAGQKSDTDVVGEIPPWPDTLGLLALGAQGILFRRRKSERAGAAQ